MSAFRFEDVKSEKMCGSTRLYVLVVSALVRFKVEAAPPFF